MSVGTSIETRRSALLRLATSRKLPPASEFGVQGLGFRVKCIGFRVQNLYLRVQVLESQFGDCSRTDQERNLSLSNTHILSLSRVLSLLTSLPPSLSHTHTYTPPSLLQVAMRYLHVQHCRQS